MPYSIKSDNRDFGSSQKRFKVGLRIWELGGVPWYPVVASVAAGALERISSSSWKNIGSYAFKNLVHATALGRFFF